MSTQMTVPPEWVPRRREYGGLLQIRRDENKKLTFKGQDQDEEVKMVVRKHPLFLIRPALPALVVLLILAIVLGLFIRLPAFGAVWLLLLGLLGLLFIGTLSFFIWRDFINWWVNIDIITNKRVIVCRGFLLPTRKVTTLDKIVQISVEQKTFSRIMLQFGDVHLYITGGDYVMRDVPRPHEVRDAVHGVHVDFKQRARPPEKLPALKDAEMNALITKLGKKEKVPELPDADKVQGQAHDPTQLRRPMRHFGGPLRLVANVTYAVDEHTVMYIQRSKWLLAFRLSLPVLGLLAAIVGTFAFQPLALFTVLFALIMLVTIGLLTINFIDDVFILTNKRVIDIERKYIFFFEERIEAEYKNIRDTKIQVKNVFQLMLDVGDLLIETPGNNPDIKMTLIDHPFFIADRINQLKGFKEKVDKARDHNRRQDELITWFTNVASVLEKKIISRGVPDFQKMDYWKAASMAAELGMKVVLAGEDDSYPQIEPGHIVSQMPLPGTLMDINPDSPAGRPQIHVVLSKRN
ncbi:MAG TPA: PH domain-containing protein [Ktedonobacteraceae bacterium]